MQYNYWDRESDYYDRQWTGSTVSEFDYANTKRSLLHFLNPTRHDTILEIGCGPGVWTSLIGGMCKRITAVDISRKMIVKAKKNAPEARFVVSDFLSFKTKNKFDKVFAVRSIEYLGNVKDGIKKIRRMLDPGGKLVVITKSKPCAWELVYHERWKRSGFMQNKIPFMKMRKLLNSLGFENIKIAPVIVRLPVFRGGNGEIPLVPESAAKYALVPGRVLSCLQPLTIFAESYVASATRSLS